MDGVEEPVATTPEGLADQDVVSGPHGGSFRSRLPGSYPEPATPDAPGIYSVPAVVVDA